MNKLKCFLCHDSFETEHTGDLPFLNQDYQYFHYVGYRPVCHNCLETAYATCPDCGVRILKSSMLKVNPGLPEQKAVCSECFHSDRYKTCTDCGERFSQELMALNDSYENHICPNCRNDWAICSACSRIIRQTHIYRVPGRPDECFCHECYEDKFNHLKRYGHKPYDVNPVFWKTEDDPEDTKLFIGIEQETDCGEDSQDYCDALWQHSKDDKLFVMKEDSSLNNGVEIVSYPCTINYFNKEYPFAKIKEIANEYGYVSHNSGNCGLHIHVSRKGLGNTIPEQELVIAKIIFLFDRFWDNIFKFSRRRNTRWCAKPDAEIKIDDSDAILRDKAMKNRYDHCRAVNLQHDHTVEFRIFRGSLVPETVKAAIQFVYVLCQYAINHDVRQCQNVNWDELVASDYEELNSYLRSKNLLSAVIEQTTVQETSSIDEAEGEAAYESDDYEQEEEEWP